MSWVPAAIAVFGRAREQVGCAARAGVLASGSFSLIAKGDPDLAAIRGAL